MKLDFANSLRALRKRRGVTQDDLATLLRDRGVRATRTTVTAWEMGRHEPTSATIKIIAEVLDTTVDELLGLTSAPNPTSPSCEAPKLPPLIEMVVNALSEMGDEDKSNAAILVHQPVERQRILMELASLEDEDLNRIRQLSRLPQQKLKAICVIAGADLE